MEDVLKKLQQHSKVRSPKNHAKVNLPFSCQPKHAYPRTHLRFLLLIISLTCGPAYPGAASGRIGCQPWFAGAEETAGS